jgi:hypothetical protein
MPHSKGSRWITWLEADVKWGVTTPALRATPP